MAEVVGGPRDGEVVEIYHDAITVTLDTDDEEPTAFYEWPKSEPSYYDSNAHWYQHALRDSDNAHVLLYR